MSQPISMTQSPAQQAANEVAVRNFNRANNLSKTADPRAERDEVSQDKFLRLLTVQLSKQDPLNPMQNTEFMAQMAQFSTLEQMTRMNKAVADLSSLNIRLQSQQFLGKYVTYTGESGMQHTGLVEGVGFDKSGATFLNVNGRQLDVNQVSGISITPPAASAAAATNN